MIEFTMFLLVSLFAVILPVKASSYLRGLQCYNDRKKRFENLSKLLLANRSDPSFIPFRNYCHLIVQAREKLNISNPILDSLLVGIYFLIVLPLADLHSYLVEYLSTLMGLEKKGIIGMLVLMTFAAQLWFIWNAIGFLVSSGETMKLFRVGDDKRVLLVAADGYYREQPETLGMLLSVLIFVVMTAVIFLKT